MSEPCARWEPIANSDGLYYLYRLYDSNRGLELIFIHEKNRSKKMYVLFENPVIAYTSTYETMIYCRLSDRYGLEIHRGWKFFTLEYSDFIKEISRSTNRIVNIENWKHFLFVTSDEVTEVISKHEPKVSWITYDLPQPIRNEDDE